jgi:hypothetical protein
LQQHPRLDVERLATRRRQAQEASGIELHGEGAPSRAAGRGVRLKSEGGAR